MSTSGQSLRLRLLELRQASGFTQREVAEGIGTTPLRVTHLERGITRRIELDTLAALASFFGVAIAELFTEEPLPAASSRSARMVQQAKRGGRPRTRAERS